MTREEVKNLLDRLDEMKIMNPATYQLGLNDEPNKRRFMDDYSRQVQWITDAYAVLQSFTDLPVKTAKATKE